QLKGRLTGISNTRAPNEIAIEGPASCNKKAAVGTMTNQMYDERIQRSLASRRKLDHDRARGVRLRHAERRSLGGAIPKSRGWACRSGGGYLGVETVDELNSCDHVG